MNIYESLLNKAINGGGSGANRKRTITGTLTECVQNFAYSDEAFYDTHSKLSTGDISIMLEADASALGLGDISIPLWDVAPYEIGFGSAYWTNSDVLVGSFAFTIGINLGDDFNTVIYMFGSWDTTGTYTDLRPYADYIPATITIYWHPMP